MMIRSLDPSDPREIEVAVAGRAALLVAKLHKIGERAGTPGRLVDKDAHDIYRLLVVTDTATLSSDVRALAVDFIAGPTTTTAIGYLRELFVDVDALGSEMVGRAEGIAGDPEVSAAAVSALANDLLSALEGA